VKNNKFAYGVAVLLGLVVGGCVPDTTAPTVSSTSPAASTTGIARNTTVTATFDEDIFAVTVDGTSFTLASTDSVSGTVSFDATTNIATFTPTNQLVTITTYGATLSDSITDLHGNELDSDYTWAFTTADGAWGSSALIETNNAGGADRPSIVTDPSGNAVVVWQQFDGARLDIWANRYVGGSGWGNAMLIETNDAWSAESPQIAVDVNGNAIAVWGQSDDGIGNNIYSNRYVASTDSWGTAALIETNNPSGSLPQVGVDASGNAIAVWMQNDFPNNNIWVNRYMANTDSWGASAQKVSANIGSANNPQVAVDPSGNAIVVWRQWDGTHDNIYANRYVVGTNSWGTAELIETLDTGSAKGIPDVAVDASGNSIAVWWQSDGTRTNIYANRYVASTNSWGVAALILSDTVGNAQGPQIDVSANGNAIVVWQQLDGARLNSWANRYIVGSGWGTAVLIEVEDAWAEAPQVGVDPSGNAVAVWMQNDGTRPSSWANRYIASTDSWGTAELLETDNTGNAALLQISVDVSGNAIAVWRQHDGGIQSIWANRFE